MLALWRRLPMPAPGKDCPGERGTRMEANHVGDAGFWVAVLFFSVLAAVALYDLYAVFSAGRFQTASHWVREWARTWPGLPFVAGLVAGHLFL